MAVLDPDPLSVGPSAFEQMLLNNSYGSLMGDHQDSLAAAKAGLSLDDYRQKAREESQYRNSAAGKVEQAIALAQKRQDASYAQRNAVGRLLQDMGDRFHFGNLSPEAYRKQIAAMNGQPTDLPGNKDERGNVKLEVNKLGSIQAETQKIGELLGSKNPNLNRLDLQNRLNQLNAQADYIQKRDKGFFRELHDTAPIVDTLKGLLPQDVLKGIIEDPSKAPLDAGIIAHKKLWGLPMGFFDKGELPSSEKDLLLAKSQLRQDIQTFGNDPIILERIQQLQDIEPHIKAAEAAGREMAMKKAEWERQDQQAILNMKRDLYKKYLSLIMQKSLFGDYSPPGGGVLSGTE